MTASARAALGVERVVVEAGGAEAGAREIVAVLEVFVEGEDRRVRERIVRARWVRVAVEQRDVEEAGAPLSSRAT